MTAHVDAWSVIVGRECLVANACAPGKDGWFEHRVSSDF